MSASLSDLQAASSAPKRRIVLVTGPSGAGRSSSLKVLEDAEFEAIDNLLIRLLPALLDGAGRERT